MAEYPESNLPTHLVESNTEESERPLTSPPPAREAMSIIQQRRQKSELRRLLKHTCPELRNVENLVEEELADILNTGPVTDSGYQNEVQSRCWVFEKQGSSSLEVCDQRLQNQCVQQEECQETNQFAEQLMPTPQKEENKPEESEEDSIRVDVKATRRMFEMQKNELLGDNQSLGLKKNEKVGIDKQQKNMFDYTDLNTNTNEELISISRAKQVFETKPQYKENIPPNDGLIREEEMHKAKVRNRAQMFESTPLDKINQQTKDESEILKENAQETLVSLNNFSILHSDGTTLEANESGHVMKAKYHFDRQGMRAELYDEEVVTGSIKSIMLQMLAGTNLNPMVAFLKEDDQGNVETQKVDVPFHHLPFTQDKECRTANVVQITEDLLSQENSLRKGVIIQDGATGMREITVYGLYMHSGDSPGVMGLGKIESRSIPSISKSFEETDEKTSSLEVQTATTLEDEDIKILKELSNFNGESRPENVTETKPHCKMTDEDKSKSDISQVELVRNTETKEDQKNEQILTNQANCEDGAVLQAELVNVVEDDELVNLQTAIMNLHKATMEAKALQRTMQAKLGPQTEQNHLISEPVLVSNEPALSGDTIKNEEITKSEDEESKDEVVKGGVQAALDSLGKSNFNVTKGDFRAAMIYRNSGKGYAVPKKVGKNMQSERSLEIWSTTTNHSNQSEQKPVNSQDEGIFTRSCEPALENKQRSQVQVLAETKKRKAPLGPKPTIPPKPDHLKRKALTNTSGADLNTIEVQVNSLRKPTDQVEEPSNLISNSDQCSHEHTQCNGVEKVDQKDVQCSKSTRSKTETPEENYPSEIQKVSESSPEVHATLQNFGVKPSGSMPPVKPKRIKMAKENAKNSTDVNSNNQKSASSQETPLSFNNDSSDKNSKENNNTENRIGDQVSQVVRREKKKREETEDERRQRLSVHMDEIMKENVPAVLEIFDKLKKQEELKNILSKVEEIEEDTNKVDVSSIRNIFESVPEWVVPLENAQILLPESFESQNEPEMMTSMEVAFGDLEKAGAEIIRLKDQTLARLVDIEEAIKKALYSVSTLKSDSDIVGLSGLFRESMVAVQGSPPSGNIRKISIGSSKSAKAQKQIGRKQQSTMQKKPERFAPTAKPRSTSPASPSFISIQSAARKPSELSLPLKEEPTEETKSQCCCSMPSELRQCSGTKAQSLTPTSPQRQVSVLEVKTMPERDRVVGTKTISENYERTDSFGNKFYSSKTSTVVTTQPETRTTSRKLIMSNPATSEFVTYPRINTPIIREEHPL